tara:strand:- start:24 stop:287 length:264 start_codon:yes stop_codon:yes gene_type:complete
MTENCHFLEREKPKITILHGAFYAVMNTDLEAHGSLQTISRVFGRKLPDVMPFSRCNVITKECGDCCDRKLATHGEVSSETGSHFMV